MSASGTAFMFALAGNDDCGQMSAWYVLASMSATPAG
jgi:putative alpha-1,2-mannosidase